MELLYKKKKDVNEMINVETIEEYNKKKIKKIQKNGTMFSFVDCVIILQILFPK